MNYGRRQQWDFPLGPVYGAAGSVQTIRIQPQVPYRVEKVMATDTGDPPGMSVGVTQFIVGNKLQRPAMAGATLAMFFGPFSLGNGLCWDTCERGLYISLTVSFIQPVTFYGSLFGSALL